MEVKNCQCPLCFNDNAFPHWTLLRQALISLTTRSFQCILCFHQTDGLDKYVLHLVSHDIFKYNTLSNVTSESTKNECPGPSQQSSIVFTSQPQEIQQSVFCPQVDAQSNKTDDQLSLMNHDSGVSLVDLLDEFTEFFQEEKASELEKAKETKIQNTSPEPNFIQPSPAEFPKIFLDSPGVSSLHSIPLNSRPQDPGSSVTTSIELSVTETLPFLPESNFKFENPQPTSDGSSNQPAQCDQCGWNYDNDSFLKVHKMLMHSNQQPSGMLQRHLSKMVAKFQCRECHQSFKNSDEYTYHLRTIHNDHRFACSLCAKLFKLKGSMLVHQRVVHQSPEGEGHFCKVCQRRFVTKYHRDVHQKRHDPFKPFECGSCGLSFDDSTKLSAHVRSHGNSNNLKCHICSRDFYTQTALCVHLESHQLNDACSNGTSGLFKYKLPEDLGNFGPQELDVSQQSPSLLSTVTEVCKSPSDTQATKSQDKFWECTVCKKTFTTKYFLKKHRRLHTGETPYACHICGKSFTFQQSYHKHMLYHTDSKPYTCTQCGRSFKELSTLQNHERIHSGERPFACETCGKSFRQRVSYLVHRRIHTGAMPYDCAACGKSFRYKVTQRTHKCIPMADSDTIQRPDFPQSIQEDLIRLRKAKGIRKLQSRLQSVLEKSRPQVLESQVPSPLDNFQQLTLSEASLSEEMKKKIINQMLEDEKNELRISKSPQQTIQFQMFPIDDQYSNSFSS